MNNLENVQSTSTFNYSFCYKVVLSKGTQLEKNYEELLLKVKTYNNYLDEKQAMMNNLEIVQSTPTFNDTFCYTVLSKGTLLENFDEELLLKVKTLFR